MLYSQTIIEDPTQFNKASLEAIRAHFEAWVDAQGKRDNWNKFRMCIIIDEEYLQTLKGISAEYLENQGPGYFEEELRYEGPRGIVRLWISMTLSPGGSDMGVMGSISG
ncbi:unnamed protein product [Penicillium nalgiovense]|nr:unnamed protein product [Penicillium nalgiovense]